MRPIYLDHNATTPLGPGVLDAMLPFLRDYFGNPSSNHALGRACQEAIEDARGKIAALVGADQDEIVFTSGGTESNNLALLGILLQDAPLPVGHLIVSAIEHPAVAEPALQLQRLGYEVTVVPCGAEGRIDPAAVQAALRPETRLVSIMHANNETGVIQPIAELAEICHDHEVLLHTDAAQTVGKIPAFVDELGVDLMTVAGHKMHAPKGVGALYLRRGVRLEPLLRGAAHEAGLRPGTENVASIVGMGHAARWALKNLEDSRQAIARLRDRLETELSREMGGECRVLGREAPRLPNTSSVCFPDVVGAELLARVPEICASTGSACHSGSVGLSPTMRAMNVPPEQAKGAVRLSLGWQNTSEDVERAVSLLLSAWEALR